MSPKAPTPLSNSQVNKAGRVVVKWVEAGTPELDDPTELDESIRTIAQFREAHARPLNSVRVGLSSSVKSLGIDGKVSQRHKRVPRIVRKLVRMKNTRLSTLEDIGGCRVVVPDPQQAEALCERLIKNWSTDFIRSPEDRNYVARPKEMGYRAQHFVVRRNGRAVEVQVRTVGQQRWADLVEDFDLTCGFLLKDEDGPAVVKDFLRVYAETLYLMEYDQPLAEGIAGRLRVTYEAVVSSGYLQA